MIAAGPKLGKQLVKMDLKFKPEVGQLVMRCRAYPAAQNRIDEMERQIRNCMDASLGKEYNLGDYPRHCSLCFLSAKARFAAMRFQSTKRPKTTQGVSPTCISPLSASLSIDATQQWTQQVDLTPAAPELLAFIAPKRLPFEASLCG